MPPTPPILSIITPSLNQAKYLPDCLRSVREQGVTMAAAEGDGGDDIEHIVIDGGSTDGSADLIARAPGLTYSVSEPDRGQSDAINKGLATARGEWATWLNADDWFEPEALPRMLDRLRADPTIDVLVGRCRFVDLEGRTIFDPRPPEPISLANLLKLRSQWFNGRLIVQPEAFFRLSLFRAVGGLNLENHYTMDHELWLKLLRAGARFKAVEIPVACMRAHPEQKTADNTKIVRCMLRFARPIHEAAAADGSLDNEAEAVGAELDAIERKLADADLIAACWDALDHLVAGSAEADDTPAPEGLFERWGRRHLPESAIALALPHVRAALRRAELAGDVLALDPSGGQVLRALTGRDLAPSRWWRRTPVALDVIDDLDDLAGVEPASLDGVVTCCAMTHLDDPAGTLRRLWQALRPGGAMMMLAETVVSPDLPAYLRHLRWLMAAQLSQDHDTLISPEAADWIEDLRAQRDEEPDAPARWAAAHRSASGVDLETIASALGADVQFDRRYGGLWYHPLAPCAEVERTEGPAADSWAVAVWRKPQEP